MYYIMLYIYIHICVLCICDLIIYRYTHMIIYIFYAYMHICCAINSFKYTKIHVLFQIHGVFTKKCVCVLRYLYIHIMTYHIISYHIFTYMLNTCDIYTYSTHVLHMSHINVIYVTYNSIILYIYRWYVYIYIYIRAICVLCMLYVHKMVGRLIGFPLRTYLELVTRSSSSVIRKTVLLGNKLAKECFQALKRDMAVCQNLVPLVNIKIAGKWW